MIRKRFARLLRTQDRGKIATWMLDCTAFQGMPDVRSTCAGSVVEDISLLVTCHLFKIFLWILFVLGVE